MVEAVRLDDFDARVVEFASGADIGTGGALTRTVGTGTRSFPDRRFAGTAPQKQDRFYEGNPFRGFTIE